MFFDHMELLDSFEVNILEDPYAFLEKLSEENKKTVEEFVSKIDSRHEQLCLRLYTINRTTKEKIVEEKSGLNQWNASGRKRNENEIYIPYPSVDRNRSIGFFPDRNIPFELILPDGKVISAKVCQGDGKAIMSNPNSELGEWLLRKVFEFPKNKIITYRDLEIYGIDSVIFTKINKKKYKIDFTYIGTYEKLLGIDEDNLED